MLIHLIPAKPSTMFEDLVQHTRLFYQGKNRTRLKQLLDANVAERTVAEVEKKYGKPLDSETRQSLLRRAEQGLKNPVLPEKTFEVWHEADGKTNSEQPGETGETGDKPKRKKRKVVKPLAELHDIGLVNRLLAQLEAGELEPEEPENAPNPENTEHTRTPEADQAQASQSSSDYSTDSSDEESDESDNEEVESTDLYAVLDLDDDYAQRKLRQWKNSFDPVASWMRSQYVLRAAGLETTDISEDRSRYSLFKQHIRNLRNILHINVLQHKWPMAYRAFCVLIRFGGVDLRALWPIGKEILDKSDRNNIPRGKSRSVLFLEWLSQFYPVLNYYYVAPHNPSGPVFRTGSRNHSPAHTITKLWELVKAQKFSQVRELFESLVLTPPYAIDGTVYFIYAVLLLKESVHLASIYSRFDRYGMDTENDADIGDLSEDMMLLGSKDAVRARFEANKDKISELFLSCHAFKFEFPERLMLAQLDRINSVFESTDAGKPLILPQPAQDKPQAPQDPLFGLHHGKITTGKTTPHLIPLRHISRFSESQKNPSGRSWTWSWFAKPKDSTDLICLKCGKTVEKQVRNSASTKEQIRHLRKHGLTKEKVVGKNLVSPWLFSAEPDESQVDEVLEEISETAPAAANIMAKTAESAAAPEAAKEAEKSQGAEKGEDAETEYSGESDESEESDEDTFGKNSEDKKAEEAEKAKESEPTKQAEPTKEPAETGKLAENSEKPLEEPAESSEAENSHELRSNNSFSDEIEPPSQDAFDFGPEPPSPRMTLPVEDLQSGSEPEKPEEPEKPQEPEKRESQPEIAEPEIPHESPEETTVKEEPEDSDHELQKLSTQDVRLQPQSTQAENPNSVNSEPVPETQRDVSSLHNNGIQDTEEPPTQLFGESMVKSETFSLHIDQNHESRDVTTEAELQQAQRELEAELERSIAEAIQRAEVAEEPENPEKLVRRQNTFSPETSRVESDGEAADTSTMFRRYALQTTVRHTQGGDKPEIKEEDTT